MAKTRGTVEELARELREVLSGEHRGRGVPLNLRRRILAAIAAHRAKGGTAREVITTLGVHEVTIYRWAREMTETRKPRSGSLRKQEPFAMVQVVPEPSPVHSTFRVTHAAAGLAIDGLDVASIAELVRRLS